MPDSMHSEKVAINSRPELAQTVGPEALAGPSKPGGTTMATPEGLDSTIRGREIVLV